MCNLLQNAGYVTGHIGKWNIGPDYEVEYQGYGIDDLRITGSISGDPRGKEGLRFDETLDFIEQYRDQPFYLNLWVYATHTPIVPTQELLDRFVGVTIDRDMFGVHMQEKFDFVEANGGDVQDFMKIYLAEVLGLDIQVGRLLDRLDELGLSENTVVAFSSDNGPERQNEERLEAMGSAGDLRGGKHSYYEGGTRVPFLVRWPGNIPAGRVDNESIMLGVDWVTTVASLAGAAYDENMFEGEDMSDVWLGNTRSRRVPLFFRQLRSFQRVYMRYGRWKLHVDEQELYDLSTDMGEFVNRYTQRPDIVEKMLVSLRAWEATLPTVHARLPDDPVPFDPTQPIPDFVIPDIPDAFASPQTTSAPFPPPNEVPVPEATDAPVPQPTDAPTVEPTGVPTRSPKLDPTTPLTDAPTTGPTDVLVSSPTTSPIMPPMTAPTAADGEPSNRLKGDLLVRVSPVSTDIASSASDGFEDACSRFFRLHIPGTIANVNCKILKQELFIPLRRRMLQQRELQDQGTLESTLRVYGIAISDGISESEFEASLVPIVNEHPEDFITSLQMWGDADSGQFYFTEVDTIQASNPDGDFSGAPTAAPTAQDRGSVEDTPAIEDDGGDGLSSGVIAGIVLTVLAVIGATGSAVWFCCKKKASGSLSYRPWDGMSNSSPLADKGYY